MNELAARIVRAAEDAMGSAVAVDLGDHCKVAAAVIRALASNPGCSLDLRTQFRDLADEIEPFDDEAPPAPPLPLASMVEDVLTTVEHPALTTQYKIWEAWDPKRTRGWDEGWSACAEAVRDLFVTKGILPDAEEVS